MSEQRIACYVLEILDPFRSSAGYFDTLNSGHVDDGVDEGTCGGFKGGEAANIYFVDYEDGGFV